MQLPCLDIIIPHYSEKPEMIRHLLDSIEGQVGINAAKAIKITIVNDKNDDSYNDLTNFLKTAEYSYPIEVLQTNKNGGAGCARQFGIDNTSLPYIMFCDADDQLYDCTALMKLLNYVNLLEMKKETWNYIWADFYEEKIMGEKGFDLIKHDQPSMIWMHGKIWKRKFLEEHNIKFHPWLRTFEDTYFGKIVALSTSRSAAHHCPDVVYLWKRNPNSVTANWTKDERSYLYWRNEDFVECTYKVLEFVYPNRAVCGRWNELYLVSLFFVYFVLQMPDFDRRDEQTAAKCNALEQLFVRMVKDFGDTIKDTTIKERAFWYSMTRGDVAGRFNFIIEKIHWNHFLQHLDNKYDIESYKLLYIKNEELPKEDK